jgi:restriction system protein
VRRRARPGTKTGPGDIRALIGVLDQDERGLFVSTGGFTGAALAEGEHHPRTTLIGIEKLAELLITHYDRLDADAQRLVPLRRIWVMETHPDLSLRSTPKSRG